MDIVVAGNYVIEQCGNHAGVVKASLDDTYNYLQRIIVSEDGTSAPYKAFLDGVDVGETKALFSRIMTGRNITTPRTNYRPVIVCVTGPSSRYWSHCRDNSNFGGFHLRDTHFVLLCPMFWTKMSPWPVPRDCNVVNSRGDQLTGPMLSGTRYTHLVHELVHMYLGKPGLQPEVYAANACLKLSSKEAAINANSYALFVGNVKASCTSFPTKVVKQAPDHELLEVDPSPQDDLITLQGTCASQAAETEYFESLPLSC